MRRILLTVAAAVAAVLAQAVAAAAEYQGSDPIGNLSPESPVTGGFADKYPLSNYALDTHVDGPSAGLGGVDAGDPGAMMSHWLASQTWDAVRFMNKAVIDLFGWAHSLDLINGTDGALAPVSTAVTALHEHVLGASWMLAAVALTGLWGIWKGLAQRRYPELATGLGASVLFVVIAMFFVYQPERTIGQISEWTNGLSVAFLANTSGNTATPGDAKREVSDNLFQATIYEPWVVLQFGGFRHCVDRDKPNENGWPRPVKPSDPARDVCRSTVKQGADGHGGYAPRFLEHPDTSEARDKEYEALKNGDAPDDPQFAGYPIDRADAPAVDIQQAGGAGDRLVLVAFIAIGSLFFVLLVGLLSVWIILAQVIALLLLAFTPVMLLLALFPPSHHLFRAWLGKLGTVLVIKAVYSLVLAVLVVTNTALAGAVGTAGFLLAFGLQSAFFALVFFNRGKLRGNITNADLQKRHGRQLARAADTVTEATLYPAKAIMSRRRDDHKEGEDDYGSGSRRQKSAITGAPAHHEDRGAVQPPHFPRPDDPPPAAAPAPSPIGPGPRPASGHVQHPDRGDAADRERSPVGDARDRASRPPQYPDYPDPPPPAPAPPRRREPERRPVPVLAGHNGRQPDHEQEPHER